MVTLIDGHEVTLDFPRYSYLEDTLNRAVLRMEDPDKNGTGLLQFRIGEGRMTVLSSMDLFDNDELGTCDHAYLLAWLVRNNRKVWLLYSSNMDGIFTLIWKLQPRFFLALWPACLALLSGPGSTESARFRLRRAVADAMFLDISMLREPFAWRCDREPGGTATAVA